jgi:hypothetical protein
VRPPEPADDGFHRPADPSPHWTETAWFGFQVPERGLAGTVYALFRPNLGVASLAVYVWDGSDHEPWRVPYGRSLWHQPLPAGDLTDLALGGLRLRCLAPLARYALAYEDGPRLRLDLRYDALLPPHGVGIDAGRGHLDQPCRVTGSLVLGGETIPVDALDMRDRSWSLRDDLRSVRASYSYAIASARDGFLAAGFELGGASRLVAGFLVRDGVKADLVGGTRRVVERRAGYPLRVRVSARDALGRSLEAEGRCASRLAQQATPGLFAWMSLAEWRFDGRSAWGADQDVASPDLLPLASCSLASEVQGRGARSTRESAS